jgi:hypothetical protein
MNKHFKIGLAALALVAAPLAFNTVMAEQASSTTTQQSLMDRGGSKQGKRNGVKGAQISHIALLDAAAKALNLTIVQLDAQLRAGQTLTSLAVIQKVNLETVKAAVIGNLKSQLDAAVKAKTITQAQADEMLARANANANFGLFGGRGGGRR